MTSTEPRSGALAAVGRFAGTRGAVILVGGWAAAEAIVLPVVPDVILALLVLAAPRRAAILFAALVAGALAGSIVLALLAGFAPDVVAALLRALPGIDQAMIDSAEQTLAREGVMGFAQLGPGPPLKVYTASWVAIGGDLVGLAVGVVLNRLSRIAPLVIGAAIVGWLFPGWLRRHERPVLVGYALAWTAVYVLYLT